MKVILLKTGKVQHVALGYAVNYLIPKKLAVLANEKNLAKLGQEKAQKEEQRAKAQSEDFQNVKKFDNKEFIVKAKAGPKGKLYATIDKKDLAKILKVEKSNIILEDNLKKTGEYLICLKFGSKQAKVKLRIEKEA